MPPSVIKPVSNTIDPWDWAEIAYDRSWTDGGTVIAPTERKVEAVLQYLDRSPAESLGPVPPLAKQATIEQVAVNCVMAGCKPEYVPVVITALQAMLEPKFNLRGLLESAEDYWPLIIVSGPVVKQLGFSAGHSVFSGGHSRANATVGRAMRLILWNIGGHVLGETIKCTLGHQGQYSYCIAENQDENPWEPLHVERGLRPDESAVTVFACDAPEEAFGNVHFPSGLSILNTIASATAQLGKPQMLRGGQVLIALVPSAARVLEGEGWTKRAIKQHIFEKARRPLKELMTSVYPPVGAETKWPRWVNAADPRALVPFLHDPEDIILTVTGGGGGWLNSICHGWGDRGGFAVTRPLVFPG